MKMITPEALFARVQAGDAPAILDVRSRGEFERGHVIGATHIPFWDVRNQSASLPRDPAKPIVVYCGHGPRAWMAGASLRRLGFTQVVYLEGHMAAWTGLGLPTVSGG
jgi:rhodanese-related sulfurtransferase